MKRRTFISGSSYAMLGTVMMPGQFLSFSPSYGTQRPPVSKRRFISQEVEKVIQEVKAVIKDHELAWMFENCYPNTLDTTVDFEMPDGKPDTFVITGDIDAMWLRDSTAQVWPYMPLIKKDARLRQLIQGLIYRQTKCVLIDPYANAFYKDPAKISQWNQDKPTMKPGVHERKFEVDSLCYVIRLANEYYQITGDASLFTPDWDQAMQSIVHTFETEQRKNGESPYYFIRTTSQMIDAPVFNGTGRPIKPVGLICSMFRPSDDATLFPFLIPSNIFAVLSLRQLAAIYSRELHNDDFAGRCSRLATEVETAIQQYAIVEHDRFGKIYAYEVDGFGNHLFMDDANVPSLMSLAYIGACKTTDPIYSQTRRFLLSDSNPYFLKGKAAEGQASPHTGKVRIWPMGIILRAMTSTDQTEIVQCIRWLKGTHAGKGFMHESFNKDNPKDYTRDWFAWANTLFGELIIKIYNEKREVLQMDLE